MVLKVLIVDDNPAVCEALALMLRLHAFPHEVASSPGQALQCLGRGEIGLVLQDMNFSPNHHDGQEGVRLFQAIRKLDPQMPVLLLTAWTSLESAVELVRQGAENYLAKPWDDAKLLQQIGQLLQARESKRSQASNAAGLLFRSQGMERVVATALKVAAADVSVLISGPNGSGKEKVAELIHAHSARRQRPFLRVNAGAIPTELLEAELFGAEVGAYTGIQRARAGIFESANGGTLFLDEIGNLPPQGQAKLLRVLQTGEFQRLGSSRTLRADVRLVCATNADLPAEIAAGRFRQDLFFRINVIEIRLPPLSERLEDVLLLARHFKERYASALEFSAEAQRCLLEHPWPGNVRELQNRVQRACLMAQGSAIEPEDLGLAEGLAGHPGRQSEEALPVPAASGGAGERELIRALLNRHGGVVAQAARALGISRQALYRKMEKCKLVLEKRTNP